VWGGVRWKRKARRGWDGASSEGVVIHGKWEPKKDFKSRLMEEWIQSLEEKKEWHFHVVERESLTDHKGGTLSDTRKAEKKTPKVLGSSWASLSGRMGKRKNGP